MIKAELSTLYVLIIGASFLCCCLLSGLLASDAAGSALSVWGVEGKIDVLLGVDANQERRYVDGLLSNADVSLSDKDASVVNRFR